MNVNFNGFGENTATFIADSTLTQPGVPVKITGSATAAACDSGDDFCGVCTGVRGGYATVQLSGYVTVGADSEIAPGYQKLSAGADGKITVSETGREHLVLDSTDDTVGFII